MAVRSPARAIRRRLGFVSSKRGEESLAPNLTLRENLFLNPLRCRRGPLPPDQSDGGAETLHGCAAALLGPPGRARTTDRNAVGREPAEGCASPAGWRRAAALLVLEEPTFGVDVGSKAEIYRLLQEAIDRGLAVLLISSDFEEVAGISSRALVFDRGRVSAELARDELSVARLTALASGGEESKIKAMLQ